VSVLRYGLAVLGAAGMLVGAGLVLRDLSDALVLLALWVGAMLVLHDAVPAPIGLGLAWAGRRVLPRSAWGPAVVGLAVTGGLAFVAATVLTRPGARRDNPSLLDRDYSLGLLVALLVVWACTAVAMVVTRRRAARPPG
jgi:hypothetical protein